jgi:hypothetical protein
MIQYNTKNKSAIKISYLLKEMGIKNHKFFLELKNPKLLNVNPHAENLTLEEQIMIHNEITQNPWYFFREVVRIPATGEDIYFEFHRGNIASIWAAINNISAFLLWPRQCYKTFTLAAYYLYLTYWGTSNNKTLFFNYEGNSVKKNLRDMKDIRDALPPYLNLYNSKEDIDNATALIHKSLNNKIETRSSSINISLDAALKAGRGASHANQWFDEIGFTKRVSNILESVNFSYSTASEFAEKSGSPYSQQFSCTAASLDTDEGRWAYKFLNNCCDFSEKFYDMDINDVKKTIKNGSIHNFLRLEFAHYDLSRDDNYLAKRWGLAQSSDNPKDTFDREVLNKWKSTNADHPLGQERLEKLRDMIKDPVSHLIINDSFMLRLYVDVNNFDFKKPLVCGLDISGNLKNDYSVATFVDPSNMQVIGVMRTNSQSIVHFASAIVTIMTDVFPNSILYPERNYNGSIIEMICHNIDRPMKRVFHEMKKENGEEVVDDTKAGIFNNKIIRPMLYNQTLRTAVDDYGDRIYDKNIIQEMEGLVRTRNGRIDHKVGEHDDTLISYLLAIYFILYEKNNWRYLDTTKIMRDYKKNEVGYSSAVKYNLDTLTIGKKFDLQEKLNMKRRAQTTSSSIGSMGDIINYYSQNRSMFGAGLVDLGANSSTTVLKQGDQNIDVDALSDIDDVKEIKEKLSNISNQFGSKQVVKENKDRNYAAEFASMFNTLERINNM